MASLLNMFYFLDPLKEMTKELKGTSLGVAAQACNPSTQAGGSLQIHGQLGLYNEFQASLGYLSQKKKKRNHKSGSLLMLLSQQRLG